MATELNQSQPEFWDQQGCQLCETEHYAAAIATFDQAIALDSGYGKAWNNRGYVLKGRGGSAFLKERLQPCKKPLQMQRLQHY